MTRRTKHALQSAVFLGAALIFLSSCGEAAPQPVPEQIPFVESSAPSSTGEVVIGVALQNRSRTFFEGLESGALGQADDLGVSLLITDAEDDAAKQLADVVELIETGVHGLVVSPVDSGAAVEIAALAAGAGVPIVAVANQIGTVEEFGAQYVYPGTVALVTNDDVAMGRKAAELVAQVAAGDGGVELAIVEGKLGTANAVMRKDGFVDELDALGIDFEIVATQPGDWNADGGAAACEQFAEITEVELIYSMSDAMTVGCADSLRELGRGDVPIVSIGGNADGIAMLAEGTIVGTVCQKPGTMGALAISTLVEAVESGAVSQGLRFYETPIVTTENAAATCIPQW